VELREVGDEDREVQLEAVNAVNLLACDVWQGRNLEGDRGLLDLDAVIVHGYDVPSVEETKAAGGQGLRCHQ
jgi:nitric oxide synthase oxygenase domain/subunit